VGKELDLEPSRVTNYIDLLDQSRYYTAKGIQYRRQKVTDNLLGDRRFCPMIRQTDTLKNYIDIHSSRLKEFYVKSILSGGMSGGHKALPYIHSKKIRRGGVYPRPNAEVIVISFYKTSLIPACPA
jgi:hypothetical protein